MTGTAPLPARYSQAYWDLPDPGNGGTLPNDVSGCVVLRTAGTELRYLVPPCRLGLDLILCIDTDGGSCGVISKTAPAGSYVPFNQTGNNSASLDDVADTLTLRSVSVAGVLRWRIVSSDGCTLATLS